MKRVILAVLGTVAGLVALLDFKSHAGPGTSAAGPLPSATLPSATTGSTTAPAPANSTTPHGGAPTTTTSTTTTAARSAVGDAIQTRYGIVQVKVTVQGSKIQNVSFVQLTADDQRSAEINQYAAPLLLRGTLSAQSAQVDTVSGASYTSDGYQQSLQSALDRAGFR
jgi:uncharacterized protein with FMN-binding domain